MIPTQAIYQSLKTRGDHGATLGQISAGTGIDETTLSALLQREMLKGAIVMSGSEYRARFYPTL